MKKNFIVPTLLSVVVVFMEMNKVLNVGSIHFAFVYQRGKPEYFE